VRMRRLTPARNRCRLRFERAWWTPSGFDLAGVIFPLGEGRLKWTPTPAQLQYSWRLGSCQHYRIERRNRSCMPAVQHSAPLDSGVRPLCCRSRRDRSAPMPHRPANWLHPKDDTDRSAQIAAGRAGSWPRVRIVWGFATARPGPSGGDACPAPGTGRHSLCRRTGPPR
jgi:hypothetical protein